MAERASGQPHSPENLAKSVAIEAVELRECYRLSAETDRNEVSDALTYALPLADRLDLDPEQIVRAMLGRTRQKYAGDKAKGRSTKYDRL